MTTAEINQRTIIGIDVSKSKLDIFVLPQDLYITADNTAKGINALIQKLKKNKKICGEMITVMEHTGGYQKLAQKLFSEAGIPVHVGDAKRISYFSKQKGYFAKTDKTDAKMIAEYGLQEGVEHTELPSKEEEELAALAGRRVQLIAQRTSEKQRLGCPSLTKDIERSIKRIIKILDAEIETIENKTTKTLTLCKERAQKLKRLKTFKGVGKLTATQLICLLPELGKLNRAEIACLCGLAPKNNDSGNKTGKRSISGGRFDVRKSLYMCAVAGVGKNKYLKGYYKGLIARGKLPKIALTAVMRKIIITLNAMLRDGKDWVAA